MTSSTPTEQLVEDVAVVHFAAIGAATKRGVEIDNAGKRGGPRSCRKVASGRRCIASTRICSTTLSRLPVAVIKLNNPTDTQADLGIAIDQLDRYRQTAPDLCVPNLLLAVSVGMLTRVGTITGGSSRFMPWRPLDDEAGGAPTLNALIRGLFELRALVDYLWAYG